MTSSDSGVSGSDYYIQVASTISIPKGLITSESGCESREENKSTTGSLLPSTDELMGGPLRMEGYRENYISFVQLKHQMKIQQERANSWIGEEDFW